MSFERILLAHDLSDTSQQALRVAVELAQRESARLTILHVYPIPVIPMADGYFVQGPAAVAEIQQAAQGALDKLKATASALGAGAVRTEAKAGTPADGILELARAGGYDLVVMGTHGRRGVSRMILGSVAEAVLRRAPCPVLTVHPTPDELSLEAPVRKEVRHE